MTRPTSAPDRHVSVVLHAEDLGVSYGSLAALHDVSLVLDPGSLLAITGPSGAGKSSLLWALAGAVTRSSGTVRLGDTPITNRQQGAELGVGIVPQGNALVGALTASENVLVPLLTAGVPVSEAGARTDAALAAVHLGDSGQHLIEELSGGQQQRVAVARTLAMRPRVLLADECTSDLDAVNRERVIALLRDEATAGAIVVMTTHDPESAAEADGELALDQGAMAWVRQI